MSRLRTPEVEVIRFNEADVIVASGGGSMTSFTIKGVCNTIEGDVTINYYNKEYKAGDDEDLYYAIYNNGLSPICYISSFEWFFVDELLRYDEGPRFSGSDGEWVYDPTADDGRGAFVKKS